MSGDQHTGPPAALAVLGASGDLTRRLLLPGLGSLLAQQPDREIALLGVDVHEMSPEDWQETVGVALREGGAPADLAADVAMRAEYRTVDLLEEEQLRALLDALGESAVLYFALPPQVSMRICELLARIGISGGLTLALEKPFGTDGPSARAFNELLAGFASEDQVFRVDHFIGTSPVLSLLQLRFANRLFRQLWNGEHIADIEIVFDEALTLEGRAAYYDHAGALKDMLQSHLLLVLAFVAMEQPADLGPEELREKMAEVLRATRSWGDDPAGSSSRARYTAGTIGSRVVPDYLAEEGVAGANDTETLARMVLEVDTPRWSGVPITIRSGKAVAADRYEIVVTFKPVDDLPAGLGLEDGAELRNQLVVDMGPALLALRMVTNDTNWRDLNSTVLRGGGPGTRLWPYGQVLECLLDADPSLSVRGDIAEELWRICDPIVEAWRAGRTPMDTYPAGSTGPEAWEPTPERRRAT